MPKHTFTTSSRPLDATREALKFTRMLARDAAATAEPDSAVRGALESVVTALSREILDLDEACDDDGMERAYERDAQSVLELRV